MSLKIRHVLDPNDLYAVFFTQQEPFGTVEKVLYPALISRQYGDEWVDEIVGFIITRDGIIPADEVPEGLSFMFYVDKSSMNAENWGKYVGSVPTWGKAHYDHYHPQVMEIPEEVFEEPKRRRRRGAIGG
jgi:hypothetical protein